MALRLNGSSSGYVELDVPADAGSHTLTLPDGGGSSGQYLQTDGSGGLSWQTVTDNGKILQAISRSTTSPTTCGNQNVWTATDCYHSITTSSSSSKVIICVTSCINSYIANQWIDVDIYRDSTRLGTNTNGMTGNYSDNDNHVPLGMTFLDSPGAAGTYTYKVYVKNRNGNGGNRFNADGQMSTMVLMEVSG